MSKEVVTRISRSADILRPNGEVEFFFCSSIRLLSVDLSRLQVYSERVGHDIEILTDPRPSRFRRLRVEGEQPAATSNAHSHIVPMKRRALHFELQLVVLDFLGPVFPHS